jgi:hypothetical protein
MAMAMTPAIRPYSMAVAPLSSAKNLLGISMITHLFRAVALEQIPQPGHKGGISRRHRVV